MTKYDIYLALPEKESTMAEIKYYPVKPFTRLKEMMRLAVEEAGDKTAFMYFESPDVVREKTYREFDEDVKALGTAIANLGFGDKHIAMIGENSYPYVVNYLAVIQSLGVFVPVDKELPPNDILNVINDSDAEVVFYASHFEELFTTRADELPKVKYFIGIDRETDDGKFLSYRTFIEEGRKKYLEGDTSYTDMEWDDQDMKLLVYTSGTTGLAKGVMLTEHNLVSCVYHGLRVATIFTKCLSVLPYNHSYEAVAGLLVALHKHATICINDNLRHVLKNLQRFKPDYIYLVPVFVETFYKRIWTQAKEGGKEGGLKFLIKMSNALRKVGIDKRRTLFKSIHDAFGGNLREIVCGGAPLRPELGAFFDAIGITLLNGYGITECSPLVSVNQPHCNDCTTVGLPLPCIKVRLEDQDENGEGEICVKGDIVMQGYYKHPELTKEAIVDGWFHTGDYGKFNKRGLLMITGRKKNLIILGNGKNIFPEEIEGYLSAIPYVQEVIVFGIKNADGHEEALGAEFFLSEEKLKEYGVTDPQDSLKRDIAKACRALPTYKHISKFYIRPVEFEKTTAKKIKRSSLMYNK